MKYKRILIIFIIVIISIPLFFLWRYHARTYTINYTIPSSQAQKTDQIRIATYNVKLLNHGEDLDKFAKEINALQPDILCLQEVDQNALRSGHMDMVKEMAQATDMPYYHFYQTMWMVDGYYGIGILSRYPITKVTSTQLPNEFLKEPRVLGQASIQINDRLFHVYVSHLSFKERDARKQQIAFISKEIQNTTDTLLLGDFNTFQETDFFSIEGMQAINHFKNPLITFRDFGFPDNIYYSNNLQLIKADTIPSSFSDHNILYCDLNIKE